MRNVVFHLSFRAKMCQRLHDTFSSFPSSTSTGMCRPQFSLKALLLLATLTCGALGSAHLVKRYGEFVEVPSHKAGDMVVMRGRLIRFFGPKEMRLDAFVYDRDGEITCTMGCPSTRAWLCAYPIEREFDLGGRSPPAGVDPNDFDAVPWEDIPPEPGPYRVSLEPINVGDEGLWPSCEFVISP